MERKASSLGVVEDLQKKGWDIFGIRHQRSSTQDSSDEPMLTFEFDLKKRATLDGEAVDVVIVKSATAPLTEIMEHPGLVWEALLYYIGRESAESQRT